MKFGEHWYDRLWTHLERAAETADRQRYNELMSIRADFGNAEDDDDVEAARLALEKWESCHA